MCYHKIYAMVWLPAQDSTQLVSDSSLHAAWPSIPTQQRRKLSKLSWASVGQVLSIVAAQHASTDAKLATMDSQEVRLDHGCLGYTQLFW